MGWGGSGVGSGRNKGGRLVTTTVLVVSVGLMVLVMIGSL